MFCNHDDEIKEIRREIDEMADALWKQGIIPIKKIYGTNPGPIYENFSQEIKLILDYLGVEIVEQKVEQALIRKEPKNV